MENEIILICDFDGTIMDTSESIIAGMIELFKNMRPDLNVDKKVVKNTIGKSLSDSFDLISNQAMNEEEKETAIKLYRENHSKFSRMYSKPFPHVREQLSLLKEKGVKLYVTSNKGEKALHSDLLRFEMAGFFEKILGDESAKSKKPNPEIFDKNIKNEISTNSRVYVWGDTDIDIRFAKAISAKSIYANYGYGDNDLCSKMDPDFTISTVSELSEIFR